MSYSRSKLRKKRRAGIAKVVKFIGSLKKYISYLKELPDTKLRVYDSFTYSPGFRELIDPMYVNSDRVPEDDKFLVELIQNIPHIQLHNNYVFRNALKERLKYYEGPRVL